MIEVHEIVTPFPAIPADNRILFYRRDRAEFGFLSNFAPAPVTIDGETWPTTEHYYQAQKSLREDYRQAIRSASTPGNAKRLSADPALPRRISHSSWFRKNQVAMRADWPEIKVEVMRRAVRAKFFQNDHLGQRLLATGAAELIEDSGTDVFWGIGKSGDGQNWLGRVLMEVRAELIASSEPRV